MIGKVPPKALMAAIVGRTGAHDEAVIQGPAYGEDTAAIEIGEQILVVNADPVSLAVEHLGTLGIRVVCNDIAASGAEPRWVTNTMVLPDDDRQTLETITRQLDEAARALDVAIVGGHAEYAPNLERPMLALSAMGVTDRYVPTGGARPGDVVLVAGSAAIEGTAILATDFEDELLDRGVEQPLLERAATFTEEIGVVQAAMAIRADATGMHDPTEGGILAGLVELATTAGTALSVDRERVPIRPETRLVCNAMDIDPLSIFGSGAVLATLPPDAVDDVLGRLEDRGIPAAAIGEVEEGDGELAIDHERISTAPRDALYDLWS